MQAIREGADAVIAVGGDGTLHEVKPCFASRSFCGKNFVYPFLLFIWQVVNGFFWAGKAVTNHDRTATHSTALGVSVYCYISEISKSQIVNLIQLQQPSSITFNRYVMNFLEEPCDIFCAFCS